MSRACCVGLLEIKKPSAKFDGHLLGRARPTMEPRAAAIPTRFYRRGEFPTEHVNQEPGRGTSKRVWRSRPLDHRRLPAHQQTSRAIGIAPKPRFGDPVADDDGAVVAEPLVVLPPSRHQTEGPYHLPGGVLEPAEKARERHAQRRRLAGRGLALNSASQPLATTRQLHDRAVLDHKASVGACVNRFEGSPVSWIAIVRRASAFTPGDTNPQVRAQCRGPCAVATTTPHQSLTQGTPTSAG